MYKKDSNQYIQQEEYCILKIQYKDIWYDFIIDTDDIERVQKYHWRTSHKKNKVYAVTGQNKNGQKQIYLHKYILNKEVPDGCEIDHINSNSFDNRKSNLRIVTRLENIQNVNVRKESKTQIRGITYHPNWHSYTVDFYFNKKRFYFPHFETLQEAIWCRKTAEEYFGLQTISRNPIAIEYFDKIDNILKQKIEEITLGRIKERLALYKEKENIC